MPEPRRPTRGGPDSAGRRWRPSLQAYLLAPIVLSVLLAGPAILYYQDENLDEVRATTKERVGFRASVAADDMERAITLAQESVAEVAANPGLSALFTGELPSGCSLTFSGAGPFPEGHIDIIGLDGRVRCSSRDLPDKAEYAGEPWLAAERDGPTVEGPVVDAASGQEALVVAAPIEGSGVVATFLDVDPIRAALAERFESELEADYAVTDEDGTVVSGSDGSSGRIAATAPVPSLGWAVHASVDEATALADTHDLNRRMLVLLLVVLLIVLVATYLLHRGVARPIRRLSATVRATKGDDAPAPVQVAGPAEVVALAEDVSELRRDVTAELAARREAEVEARASETTYRTLFDAHPVPMWIYDTDSLAFLHVNDAAVATYGYSREELHGMTIRDIRAPEDRAALEESVARAGEMDRSGPWRHLHKDGTVAEVMITSHVVDFGAHRGRLVMAEDVTQRERTRRLLEQSQRMDSLGQLAGGIAHDFNNVLAVMLNYADFAAEAIQPAAEEQPSRWAPVLRDVEQIAAAGRRAASLTHQLLSFARGQPSDIEPIDLNAVVSQIEDMLHRTLGEQTELELTLAPGLWTVAANAGQLEQVIVNLAVNARDAMPDGGRLLIETANVDVDVDHLANNPDLTPGRYVRLRVSDTGVGMDAAQRDRAFEPFFTTKERGSGTGLGLAMVYGIVSHAGGTVHLYSEPGLGTSITALLPATRAPSIQGDDATPPRGRIGGHETILLVEDDDELRAVTERILTRDGYRVLSAPDGASALSMAEEHRGEVALVLTDVVMPQMLGSELAVRLRELEPHLKVLFMSGYAPPLLLTGGTLPLGAPLIDKPFSAELLTAKVREVIDETVT